MRELVWLDSAVNDLVRLRAFIAKENPTAAVRAARTIKEAAEWLIEYPAAGKPVKDLSSHRDFSVRFGAGGYILRYRVLGESIYVIHVWHYREDGFK